MMPDILQEAFPIRRTLAVGPIVLNASWLQSVAPETDIWCLLASDISPSVFADPRGTALFEAKELARWARYRFQRDRDSFLLKRLLVRGALSQYADPHPAAWRFAENEYGKPFIAPKCNGDSLLFNLSGTNKHAVCVVSREGLIGVDAEDCSGFQAAGIVEATLSVSERCALSSLSAEERAAEFLRYWTLKEAYVKARGIGITLPIDKISFNFEDVNQIKVAFEDALDDDPAQWKFFQLRIFESLIVSIAIGSIQG
jgi:4'-phosphopantetheinyl transferase